MKRRMIGLILVLALIVMPGLLSGCGSASAGTPVNHAGNDLKQAAKAEKKPAAPAVSLRNAVTGKLVRIPGDFKGKKVILAYYSST